MTQRSDGRCITPVDYRANRLFDLLAKSVAGSIRVPQQTRIFLESASCLARHSAAFLGAVARAAKNHVIQYGDFAGVSRTRTIRDAEPPVRPCADRKVAKEVAAPNEPAPVVSLPSSSLATPRVNMTHCG